MKEKQHAPRGNLKVINSRLTGETIAVTINPDHYSFLALREIILLQLDTPEPRDILIQRGEQTTIISHTELDGIREASDREQDIFVSKTVGTIEKARSVTIRKTPQRIPPKLNRSVQTFINENLDLSGI